MDIRKWLDETTLPEQATHLQAVPIAESPRRRLNGHEQVSNRKHIPKRSRADSSLLEPSPPRRTTSTRQRKLPTEGGTDESAHGDDPGGVRSESSRCSRSSGRYARRPRRKTRPDRYEPSSKVTGERSKHVYRSRATESKRTRRKTKRNKEQGRGSGISHDFHAKNVSGDRLTLKPREQLGIFNKGKTSTAVKGRGCELSTVPDLVFSEMKFLQKHVEQSGSPRKPAVTTKKRKKDHAHSREGEISAYFTNVRPALAEKHQNAPDRRRARVKETVLKPFQQEQEQRPVDDPAVHTIETHNKTLYLGFGNRGPRHESTSYVTWSESIRAHSTTPSRPLNRSSYHERQLSPHGRKTFSRSIDVGRASSIPCTQPSIYRFEGSHLTGRSKSSSTDPQSRLVSRSQSFPWRTLSPRRVDAIDRTAKLQTAKAGFWSSMPPFLSVHTELSDARARQLSDVGKATPKATHVPCTKQQSIIERRTASEEGYASNIMPSPSSDLDGVIHQCNETFQQRSRRRPTTKNHNYSARHEASRSARRAERQINLDLDLTAQQPPRVRFAGMELRSAALANFAGPGIYEQQAQEEQTPQSCSGEEVLGPHNLEGGYLDKDYDNNTGMASEEQAWEGMPDTTFAYGHEVRAGIYGGEDEPETETCVQHVASGDSVVAAGFWRPNRLY
ncbi:hypothetical protein T440DRAFT_385369 [Plenodomus tracheiphilus IPT5]|uniref:Uncharacterized protein n=1 Tax=Plenodomus tracheiphilus IPT5 TaxID=1408161 RepID=A0A6A7BLP6_9PLEO|nr:hypothetical protein T440DRAFT_385369 [Plenodomus tracheiphilus IPT5]